MTYPRASIRLGLSGPHRISLQLRTALPALKGLKLLWPRLFE